MKKFLLILGILFILFLICAACIGISYLLGFPAELWGENQYYNDYYDYNEAYYDEYSDVDEYYDDSEDQYSNAPSPDLDLVLPDLPEDINGLSQGQYTEADCPFQNSSTRITCGYLAVPEDHQNPGEETLFLAIATIQSQSSDSSETPLIYLEGGPGGSALDGAAMLWLNSRLAADRNVILIDQRGTGYSHPSLNCTEFDKEYLIQRNDDKLTKDCKQRLESQGINLGLFNSAQNAADIEMLRKALGLNQADLLGVSYGTRLALTVIRDHPAGYRSVILDSVYPPHVDAISEQPLVTMEALNTLTNGCQADPACNQAYPDLYSQLRSVIIRLNKQPASVELYDYAYDEYYTSEVNGDDIVYELVSNLYNTNAIPYLPAFINSLYTEEYDYAYQILEMQYENEAEPVGDYPVSPIDVSDSEGMFNSVECFDEVAFNSVEDALSQVSDYESIFTDPLILDTENFFTTCRLWTSAKAPPIEDQPVRSDIPVLILNGEYDPVTPPKWAQSAADYLPNSQLFIFPGHGHAEIDAGTCPVTLMLDFLADPDQPVDASCLASISPPRFVINP